MPSQTDRFLFEITGLSQTLRVVRFTGHEGISELFRFDLVISTEDGAIAADDVIGKTALLTMLTGDEERDVHGIVARFEQGETGKKLTAYHVTVVPKSWRLLHRHDCRIFQNLTTPDIVQKVLQGAGLVSGDDFRLSLQATYLEHEYCVQYRESDWAFVSRLLEDEGIYYFFEHQKDKHVLVLGDKNAAFSPIAGASTVKFLASVGALAAEEHVHRFRLASEIQSGKVTLRDYDFMKPSLLLESKAASTGASAFTDLEAYDHPGGYVVPAHGDARAQIRLEERAAQRNVVEGEGSVQRFVTGALFTLSEHSREALNREYLITRLEHTGAEPSMGEASGAGDAAYENRFTCIPSDVPFRPMRVTSKPTVKGIQSAIVVGPAGEEIYVDETGRVKVQFIWDRLGKKDDKSSCWIRVSQLWAGEGWGAMFIPRINQEVVVDFLDGDPDRPLIIGRVYHGTNVPPYALPANKTRSTIKSNSTPGGGGSNEIRFEDKKGSEEVYIHGQKDWTIAIENDKNQTIGHDETLSVEHDRSISVGNDQTESIVGNETFSVGKDRSKSVGQSETESIGKDRTIEVGGDHTESIAGNVSLSVTKSMTEDITEDSSETVGKTKTFSAGKDYAVDVTANMTLNVQSNLTEEVKLEKSMKVGSKLTITCGDAKVTIEKNGNITVEGAAISVKSSGDVKVDSSGKVSVTASGDVKVEASGKVEVKGSGPMDLNASGPVKVKGSQVGIN